MTPRFIRIAEKERVSIAITIDGILCQAKLDDTVLTAVLTNIETVRESEFGDGQRAGFCLMGACQDCWMWTSDGERLRACTTPVTQGLSLLTISPSEATWPIQS